MTDCETCHAKQVAEVFHVPPAPPHCTRIAKWLRNMYGYKSKAIDLLLLWKMQR